MVEIKAIVLDVDGVIVGKREGINFPTPNDAVIDRLMKIKEQGIIIILCTAKPSFAIKEIVERVGLDDFHIVNGGGLIINPLRNITLKKYVIGKAESTLLLDLCLANNIRIEISSIDNYYIFEGADIMVTEKREAILRKKATIISSIDEIIDEEIMEFKLIVHKDKIDYVTELFNNENINLSLNWTFHPALLPLHVGSITVKGITKKQGLLNIINYFGISFDNVLGVGDNMNDWNFMQLCKYTAAMGDDDNLKEKVLLHNGYIGTDVDNDGIIDILDYFLNEKRGENK